MKRYEDLKLTVMENCEYDIINVDCSKVTSKDGFRYVERAFNYIPFGENNEGYDKAKEFLNDMDKYKFDNIEENVFDDADEWITDEHGTLIESFRKDRYEHVWVTDQTCLLILNFEDCPKITRAIYCYDPQGRLIHYTLLDTTGFAIFDKKIDYDFKGRIIKRVAIDSFNSVSTQYITYDDDTFTSITYVYKGGKLDNSLFTQWDNNFDHKIYSYAIDRIDNSIYNITKYQYTADSEYTFSIENPMNPKRYIKNVKCEIK